MNENKNNDNLILNTAQILKICNQFLKIPSTICNEKPFLDYLNKKIKKLGYQTILNEKYLVVKSKYENPKYLLSSHIDRHGLVKNEKQEIEYAANYYKKKLNSPFKREEIEKEEQIFINNINSIQNEYNFVLDDIYFRETNLKNIKFIRQGGKNFFEKIALRYNKENIIGYDNKTGKILSEYKTIKDNIDLEEKKIYYNLNKNPKENENIFMFKSSIQKSQTEYWAQIDNVISSAVLFYILKTQDFRHEIIFTSQEEIGKSWENIVNYTKKYNSNLKLIVLDTTPYLNFKNKPEGFLTLRKGDENGGFDLKLVKKLEKILQKNKISYDFKPDFIGRTELGRVSFESKGKINGATIQLPTTNYHTTYETSQLKGLENYYNIILNLN